MKEKTEVLQGTLALMVLKTLDVLGALHGYGIARRIEPISGDLLAVNQGTLYPVLLKPEQEGPIASEWRASENNRRARFLPTSLQIRTQEFTSSLYSWPSSAGSSSELFLCARCSARVPTKSSRRARPAVSDAPLPSATSC